jgi:hypothetical protein
MRKPMPRSMRWWNGWKKRICKFERVVMRNNRASYSVPQHYVLHGSAAGEIVLLEERSCVYSQGSVGVLA